MWRAKNWYPSDLQENHSPPALETYFLSADPRVLNGAFVFHPGDFSPQGNVPKERCGLFSVKWEAELLWDGIARPLL